ncbi:MFS transporter [Microbacterium rhizomatis]|uniref:MFS transporter n=1 Tax=Microbacterium rhizomatis TaxID=1631477 RepID=A0A5J5J888_9MICO|nr:MFS transporter [Microbacterium rhizomatis]KAA9111008.1 MFS transporter [Microbacterium rhizomatis]
MSAVRRPGGVLFAVCAALFLVVIDVTVLHVAAPQIADSLAPSATELLWIVDIYPLVIAPLLLAAGVAGDRFGRRRFLLIGLAVFGVMSVPAAFASTPLMLIGARAGMAVGAAMIMPATMALLRVAYPDRSARLRAVGIWSAVSAVGAAIGPLIGGLLVQSFWWGAVFLINIPLALAVFLLVWAVVPPSRSAAALVMDVPSVILSIIAVLALVFAIKQAARYGLDAVAVGSLLVSTIGTIWFIRRQLARQRAGIEPLLNVRLFGRAGFTVSVLAVAFSMFAIVGLDLLFAQYLQNILGYTPVEAALRLMPMAIAAIFGALSAHVIVHRFGTRIAIGAGLGLAAAALIPLLTVGASEQFLVFTLSLAVVGFVLDVALVAANDTIISAVPEDYVGQAAGVEETAYDLGGGLGIAVLGSILAATYTAAFPVVPGLTAVQQAAAAESVASAGHLSATVGGALAADVHAAAQSAFLLGFHTTITVSVAILALTAIAAAVLIRPRKAQPLATPL